LIRLQVDRLAGGHEPALVVAAHTQLRAPEMALPGPCTETHQTIAERDRLRR
jgi:hypothetical protein